MHQKTLVKRREGYKVRLTVYIYKHLESLLDTSSQIFDLCWKPCQTLFLFDRNKTQRQTSKTSEQRLAYH